MSDPAIRNRHTNPDYLNEMATTMKAGPCCGEKWDNGRGEMECALPACRHGEIMKCLSACAEKLAKAP